MDERRRVLVEQESGGVWGESWAVQVQDEPRDGSTFWRAGLFRERADADRLARRCRAILRRGQEPREVIRG